MAKKKDPRSARRSSRSSTDTDGTTLSPPSGKESEEGDAIDRDDAASEIEPEATAAATTSTEAAAAAAGAVTEPTNSTWDWIKGEVVAHPWWAAGLFIGVPTATVLSIEQLMAMRRERRGAA